jgi:hypothetical protein
LDSIATSTATITESTGKLRDTSSKVVISYVLDLVPAAYGATGIDSIVSKIVSSSASGEFTVLMNNLAAGGALSAPAKSASVVVAPSPPGSSNDGNMKASGLNSGKSEFTSSSTFWYLIYGIIAVVGALVVCCTCVYSYRKYSSQSGKLEIVKNEVPTFHYDGIIPENGEYEVYDQRKASSDRGSNRSGDDKKFFYF